jgi:hypothetical protein
MLAFEVRRHPAVTAILDIRGIDGGSILSQLTARLYEQSANWRHIRGLRVNGGVLGRRMHQ